MIKSQFTKIGLHKVDAHLELEKQITSLECDMVESHYSESDEYIRSIEKKIKLRNQWVHVDLLKMFNQLRAHMALICELQTSEPDYEDPMAVLDPDEIAIGIFVKSLFITGSDENLRVSFSGFKALSFDNQLELKSPPIRLDGDYPFATQLLDLIQDIESEARQAIYEQKGVGQLNLFDSDVNDEPGTAKPSKSKAKKKSLESFADDLMEGLGDGVSLEISHGGKSVKLGG